MTDSNKVETVETELEKEAISIFQGIINFIVFIFLMKALGIAIFVIYVIFAVTAS